MWISKSANNDHIGRRQLDIDEEFARMRRRNVVVVGGLAVVLTIGTVYIGWQRRHAASDQPSISNLVENVLISRSGVIAQQTLDQVQDVADPGEIALLKGAKALFLDHPDTALNEFAKVDHRGKHRLPLLTLTGEALFRTGQLTQAEQCLQQALELSPDDVNLHRWLATVLYDQGRVDETLSELQEVSRLAPEDFRPHYMAGTILQDFGRHDLAMDQLRKAVELAPREVSSPSRQALAKTLMSRKQFEEALEQLQHSPESPEIALMRAECHWQAGRSEEARKSLEAAEQNSPASADVLRLKGRMLMEEGNYEFAEELLQQVIVMDPGSDDAEYLLAQIARRRGNQSGADEHQARSDHIKGLKTSLTDLSQVASREPLNSEVREQLAAICEELGMRRMADIWRTAAAACKASASKGKTIRGPDSE